MTLETADFEKNGYIVLKGFYDLAVDIEPIQDVASQVIRHLLRDFEIPARYDTWTETATHGLMALATKDRALAATVYNSVKHIPALGRLVHKAKNTEIFKELRKDSLPAIAYDGYGIRLDFPHEEKFRAVWHQEFPEQQRSPDGLVFWTPLLPITEEMGPVQIASGSHKGGLLATTEDSGGGGRTGAYSRCLRDDHKILDRYEIVAPLLEPGDLLIMDYLTLHQSGINISSHARWSAQFRLFNFNNDMGIRMGWARNPQSSEDLIELYQAMTVQGGVVR